MVQTNSRDAFGCHPELVEVRCVGLARIPFDKLRVTTLFCHLTFRGLGFYNSA